MDIEDGQIIDLGQENNMDIGNDGVFEPTAIILPVSQPPASAYPSQHVVPGTDPHSPANASRPATMTRPSLRLFVESSSVISSKRTHAVLDPYDVVKIGRDRQDVPHLRIKEMTISKHHGYIYWDEKLAAWAIVDSGSVHGTFISPRQTEGMAGGSRSQAVPFKRLSDSRVASQPRVLKDLDTIILGGTSTFIVHLHQDLLQCPSCAACTEDHQISLLPDKGKKKEAVPAEPPKPMLPPSQDAKHQMLELKNTLLNKRTFTDIATSIDGDGPQGSYVDRAERRRDTFGTGAAPPSNHRAGPLPSKRARYDDPRYVTAFRSEGDGSSASSQSSSLQSSHPSLQQFTPNAAAPASPFTPMDETNPGHQMLVKKGWTPGQALGAPESEGLVEPLPIQQRPNRSGLGAQ